MLSSSSYSPRKTSGYLARQTGQVSKFTAFSNCWQEALPNFEREVCLYYLPDFLIRAVPSILIITNWKFGESMFYHVYNSHQQPLTFIISNVWVSSGLHKYIPQIRELINGVLLPKSTTVIYNIIYCAYFVQSLGYTSKVKPTVSYDIRRLWQRGYTLLRTD